MENKRGGAREGAGRKPKADEVAMIEKLSPMEDKALMNYMIYVPKTEKVVTWPCLAKSEN